MGGQWCVYRDRLDCVCCSASKAANGCSKRFNSSSRDANVCIMTSQVKTMLGDGIHVDGYGKVCVAASYESNVPFVLRFMVSD